MDNIFSTFVGYPVSVEEGEVFPWTPDTAPGVDPAKSLEFLRPAGPPPAGSVLAPQLSQNLTQPYERPAVTQKRTFETLLPLPALDELEDCEERPAKKRRIIENPSQFRDIVPYFATGHDSDGNRVAVEAPCPVCGCLLELPSTVMPTQYADLEVEPLVVLPCGHLFGFHCLSTYLEYKDEMIADDRLYNPYVEPMCRDCPLCRFRLVHGHEGCNHNIEFGPYEPQCPRAEQLPLTILEGGFVDDVCRSCILGDTRAEIEDFCQSIVPDMGTRRYRNAEVLGPDHVNSIRSNLIQVIWNIVQWQSSGVLDW
ncbi:hypothetical protein SUNI508_08340 [Seiridium unicorne]|uniref:RING-type domain-containing protein n=1 Tax=Seiridium unicorne TaxID=138068 RepID=A0ABR2UUS2_9PEZI